MQRDACKRIKDILHYTNMSVDSPESNKISNETISDDEASKSISSDVPDPGAGQKLCDDGANKDGFGMWRHPHYDPGGRAEAAALAIFVMYIYYRTLPPSITGGDSGEVNSCARLSEAWHSRRTNVTGYGRSVQLGPGASAGIPPFRAAGADSNARIRGLGRQQVPPPTTELLR